MPEGALRDWIVMSGLQWVRQTYQNRSVTREVSVEPADRVYLSVGLVWPIHMYTHNPICVSL